MQEYIRSSVLFCSICLLYFFFPFSLAFVFIVLRVCTRLTDSDHLLSCRKRKCQVRAVQLTSSNPLSYCRGGNHSSRAHSPCERLVPSASNSVVCSPTRKSVDAPQQVLSICFTNECHTCLYLQGVLRLAHIQLYIYHHIYLFLKGFIQLISNPQGKAF